MLSNGKCRCFPESMSKCECGVFFTRIFLAWSSKQSPPIATQSHVQLPDCTHTYDTDTKYDWSWSVQTLSICITDNSHFSDIWWNCSHYSGDTNWRTKKEYDGGFPLLSSNNHISSHNLPPTSSSTHAPFLWLTLLYFISPYSSYCNPTSNPQFLLNISVICLLPFLM